MYDHVEIKNFQGLFLNKDSYEVPDGAMEVCLNCILNKEGVIESRRGYPKFNTPAGGATVSTLALYQSNLVGMLNNKVSHFNTTTGAETANSGATVSVTAPLFARNAQASKNLFFTSDNGVMKLENFDGTVWGAGVPPALDIRGKFQAANGPIAGDTQVGYRVVFGRMDANNNLLLGAPSDFLVLTNRQVVGASYAIVTNVVTVTTSSPHNLSTGMVIQTNTDSGSIITPATNYTITVTGATTFTFPFTHANASGTINYTATRNTNLEFSIPSEIQSTQYFYQIYRTSQSATSLTTPFVDFELIQQTNLVAGDISAGVIFFTDTILDLFRGAELYTNPNSQEGELQANNRPPYCLDIANYKEVTLYANTTTRQQFLFNLISTSSTYIVSSDYIEIKIGSTTRRYVARTGVGNNTSPSESITGSGTLTVTLTAHGFVTGDVVYISNVQGGAFASGIYTVGTVATNTFQVTGSGTATSLDVQATHDASGNYIFDLVPPGSSVSAGIDTTARCLVKAINRDPSSLVYAHYISGVTDVPGKMYLEAKGFGVQMQLRANTTTSGSVFSPAFPSSFGSVVSNQVVSPNGVLVSKDSEPEAVPATNQILVGAANKAILRVFALRDSVVILKEDGVWRLDGDDINNFTAVPVDTTAICVAPNSGAVLNNQVVFLSLQGVCMVTNYAVQVVSLRIADPIRPILGYAQIQTSTAGVAYESAGLYLLTTMLPNTTAAATCWVYDAPQNKWSHWDTLFTQGVVGPNDVLYTIGTDNILRQERKLQKKTDYADDSFAVTSVSISADKFSGIVTSSSYVPQVGDIIVYQSIITRISKVGTPSGSNYPLTFDNPTNMAGVVSAVIYVGISHTMVMSPYHAGMVDRAKQFSQLQIHTRDDSISAITISYTTDGLGGSDQVFWKASNIEQTTGWGNAPWGFFPWGQDAGINLNYQTKPAPIIRTYIPTNAQRTTYIQANLTHRVAGEIMNIQSLGYTLRGYGERVTR